MPKGRGIGLKFGEAGVTTRFPAYLKKVIDSMGRSEKQDFIRAAVVEKMKREGIFPFDEENRGGSE